MLIRCWLLSEFINVYRSWFAAPKLTDYPIRDGHSFNKKFYLKMFKNYLFHFVVVVESLQQANGISSLLYFLKNVHRFLPSAQSPVVLNFEINFMEPRGQKNRILNLMWKFVNKSLVNITQNICPWQLCCDCHRCGNLRTILEKQDSRVRTTPRQAVVNSQQQQL